MAYTTDDLQALKDAYATGALTIRHADGRQTTFASGDDLRRRILDLTDEIAAAEKGPRQRIIRTSYSKGL